MIEFVNLSIEVGTVSSSDDFRYYYMTLWHFFLDEVYQRFDSLQDVTNRFVGNVVGAYHEYDLIRFLPDQGFDVIVEVHNSGTRKASDLCVIPPTQCILVNIEEHAITNYEHSILLPNSRLVVF